MKVSKIPGLGDYGHYVDGVDFYHITDEEWLEIGKLNLAGLVTVLRDIKMDVNEFRGWVKKFGPVRIRAIANIFQRNGVTTHRGLIKKYLRNQLDPDDMEQVKLRLSLTRNTPTGDLYRVLSHGPLNWHANEAACINATPNVALLGHQDMRQSATGFTHTVEYYNSLSEATRSEYEEMVVVYKHNGKGMTPVYSGDDVLGKRNRLLFCPEDGMEVPLVTTSPGGIKSIRYPRHEVWKIKGMTEEQSRPIFDDIEAAIFKEGFPYMHHYQTDNDLLLFDNTVTLHCREGGLPTRVAYRLQYDYHNPKLGIDQAYVPFSQPDFMDYYHDEMKKVVYE